MNLSILPCPPESFDLKQAVLTTFDFDPVTLFSFPFMLEEFQKIMLFYGEGREVYASPPQGTREFAVLEKIQIPIRFPKCRNTFPSGFAHGKLWLFEYRSLCGDAWYYLVIHSANITPHNNLETYAVYTGRTASEIQNINQPILDYLSRLKDLMPADIKEYSRRQEQLSDLISDLSFVRFEPAEKNCCEQFSFLFLDGTEADFLFEPCEQLLVIAPFIQCQSLQRVKEAAGSDCRLVIVSNLHTIQTLIKNGVSDAELIPVESEKMYLHAKCYLRKTNTTWQLYSGSMNLTEYSMNKNLEFMSVQTNPRGVTSIESFLSGFLGMTAEQFAHRFGECKTIGAEDSAIFRNAAEKNSRYQYLQHYLNTGRKTEQEKERAAAYLLENTCVRDLNDLLHLKQAKVSPRETWLRMDEKPRRIFQYPFYYKLLLGLVNQSLHASFDNCFSIHVYSHIKGRHFKHAFFSIRDDSQFSHLYLFKTDIKAFEPSIDGTILKQKLREMPGMDMDLYRFFERILESGESYPTVKTGCPLNGFFENVYLRDLDSYLDQHAAFYCRFADDILIGAPEAEELEKLIQEVNQILRNLKLECNTAKSLTVKPGDTMEYLGWKIQGSEIDYTETDLKWIRRQIVLFQKKYLIQFRQLKLDRVFRLYYAVNAEKILEKKLGIHGAFPIITRTDSLKQIDHWLSDMIRTLVSGKTGRGKYRVTYQELKKWGYQSTVAQYYAYIANSSAKNRS